MVAKRAPPICYTLKSGAFQSPLRLTPCCAPADPPCPSARARERRERAERPPGLHRGSKHRPRPTQQTRPPPPPTAARLPAPPLVRCHSGRCDVKVLCDVILEGAMSRCDPRVGEEWVQAHSPSHATAPDTTRRYASPHTRPHSNAAPSTIPLYSRTTRNILRDYPIIIEKQRPWRCTTKPT